MAHEILKAEIEYDSRCGVKRRLQNVVNDSRRIKSVFIINKTHLAKASFSDGSQNLKVIKIN